jgi:parvulin-like peptidyl-prolyl isomerase
MKPTQFTERATARWRMIKVSSKNMGSVDAAEQKARELHERIAGRGEDFAVVASSFNHDASLLRNGGDVGVIDKGAYRLEAVEQTAWGMEPGQVSAPLRVGDDFYLVRLEEKKTGRVIPFEEPGVQSQVREVLQREQFAQLRDRAQQELQREAIGAINVNQEMVRTAMEIAMQNYPRWSKSQ